DSLCPISFTTDRKLKNRKALSTTATPAAASIFNQSRQSLSFSGTVTGSRSRNGFSSSRTSAGKRVRYERKPANQGCSENAANSTANGGQYSAILFQRAFMIINVVEKSRKNIG